MWNLFKSGKTSKDQELLWNTIARLKEIEIDTLEHLLAATKARVEYCFTTKRHISMKTTGLLAVSLAFGYFFVEMKAKALGLNVVIPFFATATFLFAIITQVGVMHSKNDTIPKNYPPAELIEELIKGHHDQTVLSPELRMKTFLISEIKNFTKVLNNEIIIVKKMQKYFSWLLGLFLGEAIIALLLYYF